MKRSTKFIDLTARRFGRLRVLGHVQSDVPGPQPFWQCRCDCGTLKIVHGAALKSGATVSYGCFNQEKDITHGAAATPEYVAWQQMKDRCFRPSHPSFHNYGGRGVTVWDRWINSFEDFLAYVVAHVGLRPSAKHSLDRYPNKNGNYEPGNIRWATQREQAQNRRNNVVIEFDGRRQCVAVWAREKGLLAATIFRRLSRGWPADRLFDPQRQYRS
jgi:hypothetical protein